MVLTLAIPLRAIFGLKDFITMRHIQNMAKVMLATGLIVVYGYMVEIFMAWYSGNQYEQFMILNRITGPVPLPLVAAPLCNVSRRRPVVPEGAQQRPGSLFIVAMFVNVGMWLERFVIVVTSLTATSCPPRGACTPGTIWDWATLPRHDRPLRWRCCSSSSASCR